MEPTYQGFVASTDDALILFEACLTGVLSTITRRPSLREKFQLAQSGNVFVYTETEAGIQRWTDKNNWSPSRPLDRFVIYRELSPGKEKKMVAKDARQSRLRQKSALVGTLQDSYMFKPTGLVKKTMAMTVSEVKYRLISYYCPDHVNSLNSPSTDVSLMVIRPRASLIEAVGEKERNHDNYGPSAAYPGYILSNNCSPGYSQPQTCLLSTLPDNYSVSGPYTNFHGNTPQICEEKDGYSVNTYMQLSSTA